MSAFTAKAPVAPKRHLVFLAVLFFWRFTSSSALAADALPASPPADAPTVVARVDKAEVRVGDVIALTVTAIGPRGTPVNLPATLELTPFSVLDRRQDETDLGDGKMRRDFLLQVAAYEPGELAIPPVPVSYLGQGGDVRTVRTEPVAVKITSLLANEPEPELKENAPPVRVLQRDLTLVYLAAGLGAAGLGALIAMMVRSRLRARAASLRPPPLPRPAHEIALEKLDRLGAHGFGEGDDHRPFTFEISEIVRAYLGARYGFESLELTTEELVVELRRRAGRELVFGEIEGWLSGCDLVKFAKISPSATEARGTYELAIRIIESTRPRAEPQVIAAPEKEAASA